MQKKILLVEDEESLHEIIKLNLELENYLVESTDNGKTALNLLSNSNYDLVLLDVMLPGMDGFTVCKNIREKGIQTPVLFLTAKGTSEDRIKGLKLGGDDYLVKPFHLEELLLRVHKLLTRFSNASETTTSETYSFGEYTIDFSTYEFYDAKQNSTALTKREIELLKLLISNAGKVVSREEILDRVWGEDAFPSSRTIDNYILAFRKYFEKNPKQPIYFHSIRGVGYKFTA